jgi:hypothetical protein
MGQGEQDWIKTHNLVDLACRNQSAFPHVHFTERGVIGDRERKKILCFKAFTAISNQSTSNLTPWASGSVRPKLIVLVARRI